ncbi:FMN-binding negative transcriptional regulator [Robbsia andropogonis]|uniref:FMN-binding negative transcriptional regulator n=1 Tax=Robbsia andropogonis TaxID=28092 RepID=UPI0004631F2A|nr:FMN-binding negative transcriptional regulator [Robbsia andropogonis]
MYIPSAFLETDTQVLHALMIEHPLGTLVTRDAQGFDANHLPFELSANGAFGTLHAHVARANPLWQTCTNDDNVMVIFHAGDAYISPSWYPSKHEHHRQVPTWNYTVVHAHGRIRIRDDEAFVRGVVARLTRTHEADEAVPWKMGDAPSDYLNTMLKAIVGVEIEITRLVGKRKLGQNKDAADILGASDALIARGQHEVGAAMSVLAAKK